MNIVRYYQMLEALQKQYNQISQSNGNNPNHQALIEFKVEFTDADASYQSTPAYKKFMNQKANGYVHDFKILILYHIKPPKTQNFQTTYPTISFQRVTVIKYFTLKASTIYEGIFLSVPQHFVPAFRKLLTEKETGFKVTTNIDRFTNKSKRIQLPDENLMRQIQNTNTFFTFMKKNTKLDEPIVYVKDLDDDPDLIPFNFMENAVMQRTHSVLFVEPSFDKLFPSNKLSSESHNEVNIDAFANETGLPDCNFVPNNKSNGYALQIAGTTVENVEFLDPTIKSKLNTFLTQYLHRLLHTQDQNLFSAGLLYRR